jgi:hypothetical protein
MKYKHFKKSLSVFVAVAVFCGVLTSGWLTQEVEACNPPAVFGSVRPRTTHIDNAVGIQFTLGIHSSALTTTLTLNEVYRNVDRVGTWHGVQTTTGTVSTTLRTGSAAASADVWVEGSFNPLDMSVLGVIIPMQNGATGIASPDSVWSFVDIVMNTDHMVWIMPRGWSGPILREQEQWQLATHVFLHEIGHVLKMAHKRNTCNVSFSIMCSASVPRDPGFTTNVTAHDRVNLQHKW